MFEKEAEEIAKDIYIHHFDDDVNYPCVIAWQELPRFPKESK